MLDQEYDRNLVFLKKNVHLNTDDSSTSLVLKKASNLSVDLVDDGLENVQDQTELVPTCRTVKHNHKKVGGCISKPRRSA